MGWYVIKCLFHGKKKNLLVFRVHCRVVRIGAVNCESGQSQEYGKYGIY